MAKTITVTLLGGLQIEVDNRPIPPLPTRVAQAIFIHLLYNRHPIPRERLLELFFAESTREQGLANLRATLSRIRKTVGDVLESNRFAVSLREELQPSTDAARFEQLSMQHSLVQALSLYEGEFLAGFALRDAPEFEQWMVVERERLRLLAIDGLQTLIGEQVNSAEFHAALQQINRLLAIEPLLEEAHRTKMLLLARTGQRAPALRHYTAAAQIFDEELAVPLTEETTALRNRIQHLPDTVPHNLPRLRSEFIGRNHEINTIRQTLAKPANRYLTLTGMGGVGKTRLALHFAHTLIDNKIGLFLDGIYVVYLHEIDHPERIPLQIADALDLSLRGSEPPIEQIITHLQSRETLLIFDNIEHLAHDQATRSLLKKLLTSAPDIKLLLTSRQNLTLTAPANNLALSGLPATTDALNLFLTTARRQTRSFAPVDAELAAAATICQQVAGIPLAIELAAGQTRTYSCIQIATDLQHSYDSLTTRFRNVPPRQRSLRAIFDYSWHLLIPEQQLIFARLAIFPASFTATAAETITHATRHQLSDLQNRSLLSTVENDRYQLHPALREYATEQRTETAALAARHAGYYATAITHLTEGGMDKTGYELVRRELPNLRRTWQHFIENQQFAALRDLVLPLYEFFNWSSRWQDGIELFGRTQPQLPTTQPVLKAMLDARIGRFHIYTGQLDRATQTIDNALKILTDTNEHIEIAAAAGNRARATILLGDYPTAQTFAETGLTAALRSEDAEAISYNHTLLGTIFKATGDYTNSRTHMEAALAISEQQNDRMGVGIQLNNLGNLLLDSENFAPGLDYMLRAVTIFRELEFDHGVATALANAAVLHLHLNQLIEAETRQQQALTIKRRLGNKRSIALSLTQLCDIWLSQKNLENIPYTLAEALDLALAVEPSSALDDVLITSAEYLTLTHPTLAARIAYVLQTHRTPRQPIQNRLKTLNLPKPSKPESLQTLTTTLQTLLTTQPNNNSQYSEHNHV